MVPALDTGRRREAAPRTAHPPAHVPQHYLRGFAHELTINAAVAAQYCPTQWSAAEGGAQRTEAEHGVERPGRHDRRGLWGAKGTDDGRENYRLDVARSKVCA